MRPGPGAPRRPGRALMSVALLTVLGVVVPDASRPPPEFALVQLDGVEGLDATDDVIWMLALGSDARPGEPVMRSRSDAIQLVGMNTVNQHAVTIGIPRDSYVDIRGFGRDKINAAMVYGGPEATAGAVTALTGIEPDYVFVASFPGLIRMVNGVGGVRAEVTHEMDDLNQVFHPGPHRFSGVEALAFARIRYGLPGGDFDRSMDQGELLAGGLATLAGRMRQPGYFERALGVFARYTDTNLSPVELYRLGRTVMTIDPAQVRVCVLKGSTGYAGAASVVFADLAATRSLVADVRNDATVDQTC